MAFNPFLSMNEPVAPAEMEELNPFITAGAEPITFDGGDNPFATSNPFSDFGGSGFEEPPVGDTVPVDFFGTAEPTGVGAKQFFEPTVDIFGSQPIKPTELELITTTADDFLVDDGVQQSMHPLPTETQNLILSVTGQMEFNSSHLLDRIPPTRTPSPVSVRDIHSPSPTPEPDFELDHEEPPQPPVVENAEATRAKPARPPPRPPVPPPVARLPPPRPAPPPVPQMPQRPPPPQQTTDEINLFDAPTPVVVKPTKEAILSLYSAPKKEEKQIDFLSDDIMDSMSTDSATDAPPMSTASELSAINTVTDTAAELFSEKKVSPISAEEVPVSTSEIMFPTSSSPQQPVAPMDCSEPATEVTLTPVNNTSPFADSGVEDFQALPEEFEKNPFESGEIDTVTCSAPGGNIFGVDTAELTPKNNVFGMDSDNFGTDFPTDVKPAQTNIFGTASSPFDDKSETDAFASGGDNIFGISQPANSSPFDDNHQTDAFDSTGGDSNIFGVSQPAASTDLGWGDASEAMVQDAFPGSHDTFPDSHDAFPDSHDAFPESQDAFDAFSAKFDSTSANKLNSSEYYSFLIF